MSRFFFSRKLPWLIIFLGGVILGFILFFSGKRVIQYTSTNTYCKSCHVHPHATNSWKLSTHYNNSSGVVVHCTECHLPPDGILHITEKARMGVRDIYGKLFKDISKINWEEKSDLAYAVNFTYKESCIHCHQNLFPLSLSKEGDEAHLYYNQMSDQLRCINCHLYVGHYSENIIHAKNVAFGKSIEEKEIYTTPAVIESFENFTEYVPGSYVKFEMIAIPEGSFVIGSPEKELYRKPDEGPQRKVFINRFFMGKFEVTWDEYIAFYNQTASEGRQTSNINSSSEENKTDAITGATPPYGPPDQGWGMGSRPAITMTHHAAEVYCQWLSIVTGKKYRLPTETEWEYACRAGTDRANFFNENPRHFSNKNLVNRIIRSGKSNVNAYVLYAGNSLGKTIEPTEMEPNPFGLVNMLGNVSEFCSDWYASDAYSQITKDSLTFFKGPESGTEHVVRGGSFRSEARGIRSAARNYTRTDAWLLTDPQMPKSIWWYSDCNWVGFRVICEYDQIIKLNKSEQ